MNMSSRSLIKASTQLIVLHEINNLWSNYHTCFSQQWAGGDCYGSAMCRRNAKIFILQFQHHSFDTNYNITTQNAGTPEL